MSDVTPIVIGKLTSDSTVVLRVDVGNLPKARAEALLDEVKQKAAVSFAPAKVVVLSKTCEIVALLER